MAVIVTVAQVRTQIADLPQLYPPQATPPEIIGIGDGAATIFGLTYPTYIASSLTVYQAAAPAPGVSPSFVAVAGNLYAVANGLVTFAAAPAAGALVAARYQATAFADADLQAYITNATLDGYASSARRLLKAVQYDLIDAILVDQRRLTILAEGSGYRNDPSAFVSALKTLATKLSADIAESTDIDAQRPSLGVAVRGQRPYGPLR